MKLQGKEKTFFDLNNLFTVWYTIYNLFTVSGRKGGGVEWPLLLLPARAGQDIDINDVNVKLRL